MYIFGGYVGIIQQLTISLYALDLANMQWTELPQNGEHPMYRDFHTMNATPDGNVVVFGGREVMVSMNSEEEPEFYPSVVHLYDMSKKIWQKLPAKGNVPIGRRSHSSFIHR